MNTIIKNKLSILFLLVLSLSVSVFGQSPKSITILHTNDIHGHFTPDPASWLDDNPPVGGFAALDYYITRERNDVESSLLLDAGDFMTGNLICKKKHGGAYGGAIIEMMNMIGYDCSVIGNHEFDAQGSDISAINNIIQLERIAEFPILCANMIDSSGNEFSDEHFRIFDVDGLKVGVIGVTYHQMLGMASADNLEGFYSTDPAAKVNQIVGLIDSKTDLIIVLSHLGYENDEEMANKIHGVDLIIGGHSHSRITHPDKVNGVIIAQAGSYNHDLGRIDLTVAGDTVQSYNGKLITPLVANTKAQPRLQAFIDSFAVMIEEEYGAVISHLKQDWRGAYNEESNTGDWLTDALAKETGADIAFLNSGGIRKNIMAGPITKKDINEMLPFQNYVELFDCSGKELKAIAQENAEAQGLETHGILQLSGLSYSWRKDGRKVIVSDIKVNDKPVQDDKIYRVASVDYVNGSYDKYYGIKPRTIHNTGMILADVIIDAILKTETIDAPDRNRITQLD